ncbi:type II toxin-antitoxin system ParD family antitoxin [Paramagnetospirillum kuznetsovii]|uniref:Type II toxin-antitoxin system ParD family antitoxin n=1 Tax=Paramagnetospirillum kuznetsovii TaxID=2053833 RepID=A0A364NXZ1_9PROT|nr:type II toxin-antitoxin system ParD family antitoxin [Paramagnetospirillum kuznetsovii]RAU21936.1 type II toxin-antitoxin system ParD family antitoxin [Paramagnetospirillum kuznetsovii]
MNVSLTPDLEAFIHDMVKSGGYASASEVVRDALRRLVHDDSLRQMELKRLRAEIQVGLDQADRGEVVDGEDAMTALIGGIANMGRQSG